MPRHLSAPDGLCRVGVADALAHRFREHPPPLNLRPLSTERNVQAGFALALACLAVIGVVSFQSVRQLREDQAAIHHTHEVNAGESAPRD